MLNIIATTASARFAVREYMDECAPCAFEADREWMESVYSGHAYTWYDAEEEFFFSGDERDGVTVEIFTGVIVPAKYGDYIMSERHYDEEVRPRLEEWLWTPEAMEDINYSDIFKDVYGVRPRFCCGRGYWSY